MTRGIRLDVAAMLLLQPLNGAAGGQRNHRTVTPQGVVGEDRRYAVQPGDFQPWQRQGGHDVIEQQVLCPGIPRGFCGLGGAGMVIEDIQGDFFKAGVADLGGGTVQHAHQFSRQGLVHQQIGAPGHLLHRG